MKRMIVFIFCFLALFSLAYAKLSHQGCSLDYSCLTIVTNDKNLVQNANFIQNGGDFYFTFDRLEGQKVLKDVDFTKVRGLVYKFSNDYDFDYFNKYFNYNLFGGNVIEGEKVFYGYDKNYSDYTIIENKRVNAQLVQNKEGWLLGYPLILTGF